jgi:amino acid transporter
MSAADTIPLVADSLPGARPQLRSGVLTPLESLSQSIANIAPTLTPALNVTVVAGLAGRSSWLAYLVATIAMLFVAANINALAKRHTLSGSFFIYIGRTLGPFAGVMAGWSMIAAYLLTAVAVIFSIGIFLGNVLTEIGVAALAPPAWLLAIVFTALVGAAAYRDIKFSSRIGLVLEGVSIAVIIAIIAVVAAKHGTVVDPAQTTPANLSFSGVMSALTFAVFSFVGFESSATLAKETADPQRNVPRAIMLSAALVGLFFVVTTYLMVLGMDGDAETIGKSSSPFGEVTAHAGIPWAAAIVYAGAMISGFACALASINAASRLIFSMGRFRMFGAAISAVHDSHRTPHRAVALAAVVCLAIVLVGLQILHLAPLDAFGDAGTVATFGFLVVYLLVCIVAPMDLARHGDLKPINILYSVVGVCLMLFVIWGSLYPVPDYPLNLLPYIFAAYMLIGAAWFLYLKRTAPEELLNIEHDLEEG